MAQINRNWENMTPDELRAFVKNLIEKHTNNPDLPQDNPEFLQLKASVAAFEASDDKVKALEAKLREAKVEARKSQAKLDAKTRAVYKTQRPKK